MSSALKKIKNIAMGYMQSCVLQSAAELDIFTLILENNNTMSAEDISEKLKSDLGGTRVLLDTLASMEFLFKKIVSGKYLYSVPEEYVRFLHIENPESFIPMLRHMAGCMRSWSRLSWSLLSGKPQDWQESILGEEQDDISFILAMNSAAIWDADPLIKKLKASGVLDFEKEEIKILDIGGASGTYSKAFCDNLPQAKITIFDLPVGIEQAKKRFEGSPYEKRISLEEGDFFKDELPKGYDLAWVSAIIHAFGESESMELYSNAFKALKPGGKILVRDYVMSPDRTSSLPGALFGVNMLVNTENGRVYTYEEIEEGLKKSGFRKVSLAVNSDTMSAVVLAHKI